MSDFELNRMAVISLLDVTEIKTEASWSRDTKHDRNLILGFVKSYLQKFQQTQVLAKWACSVSSKMVLHVSRIRKNKHDLSIKPHFWQNVPVFAFVQHFNLISAEIFAVFASYKLY